MLDDPEGRALVCRLMTEVLAVARADGAKPGEDRVEFFLGHSDRNLRAIKTSTYQDFERGKRLEYEALSGAVVRTARRHGVAVPAMAAVHALMKLLDQGRRQP